MSSKHPPTHHSCDHVRGHVKDIVLLCAGAPVRFVLTVFLLQSLTGQPLPGVMGKGRLFFIFFPTQTWCVRFHMRSLALSGMTPAQDQVGSRREESEEGRWGGGMREGV